MLRQEKPKPATMLPTDSAGATAATNRNATTTAAATVHRCANASSSASAAKRLSATTATSAGSHGFPGSVDASLLLKNYSFIGFKLQMNPKKKNLQTKNKHHLIFFFNFFSFFLLHPNDFHISCYYLILNLPKNAQLFNKKRSSGNYGTRMWL